MAFTIKEFMDYLENSTETKCRVIDKETNDLLFSGSIWEIPAHYQERGCTIYFPIDFGETLNFFVEPFDTTGMMKVMCLTHHNLPQVKFEEICYFDRNSIYINSQGGVYGCLYSKNGRYIGCEPLSRYMSVG